MLDPNNEAAHGNLGTGLIALGQPTEARAALQRAIKLAPRNVRHRRYLGELAPYVASDPRLAALEKLAHDASRLSIDDRIELHFGLGKAYDDMGRHADAFRQWHDGNALRRQRGPYDEAATLAALDRIRSAFTPEFVRMPGRMLTVRYEDVVADLETQRGASSPTAGSIGIRAAWRFTRPNAPFAPPAPCRSANRSTTARSDERAPTSRSCSR